MSARDAVLGRDASGIHEGSADALTEPSMAASPTAPS